MHWKDGRRRFSDVLFGPRVSYGWMNYIEWVRLPNLKRITLSLLLETYLLLDGVPDDTGHLISVQLYPKTYQHHPETT
jgi:hypothetical protein